MGLIIDEGKGKIYNFELRDQYGNNHFYEIYSETLQSAIKLAQKLFVKDYRNRATHLERNVTGFPITRNT